MIDYAAATKAIVEGRLSDAWTGSVKLVSSDEPGPFGIVEWYPARSEVVLHRTLRDSPRLPYFALKIPPTLAVLEAVNAVASGPLEPKPIRLNLDDIPSPHGIAFVSKDDDDHFLVPDPNFIRFNGYADLHKNFDNRRPWNKRIPVVFWRGGTSGRHPGGDWRKLPRLELCRFALKEPLIDAGITQVGQLPDGAAAEIAAAGLRRARVPAELFDLYRALIAIDGNSWPTGLYPSMLTGSPVLKVASLHNFRQWYYDRLKPWIHYIPVAADLSDLREKAVWVFADGDRAAKIGESARAFAQGMTVTSEIGGVAQRIARALSQAAPAKPKTTSQTDQRRIVQTLLEAHPEKRRLIFVHIPKCAGTDLASTLKHFPAIHDTLANPNWQKPETLDEAVAEIERKMAEMDSVLVHGHLRLRWIVNSKLSRAGDRLFTIVRDPAEQLISQVNYIATRLTADPAGKRPDTSGWLRAAGLSTAEGFTPEGLLEIALKQVQSNPICFSLGDATLDGTLELIRRSAIEITDTDRYSRWGEATWGAPFVTRHNTSKKFITEIDKASLERHCALDIELYERIRAALGNELFVRGDRI
jgi:hypothetical protein